MFIFLVVLVTLGIVIEILSLKNTIAHIDYRCIPVKYGCEPGEVFQLRTTITNYGARTIPFLKLIEILPKEIDIQNGITLEKDIGRSLSVSVIYIRGRQKITRTQQATLPRRGLYFLAGCRLMSGDFLGIKENSRDIKQWEEIIIFPKLLKDSKVHQILSEYYGDFSARRLYIEDPVLVNSYRDYTGREPMRSISWIQSAKKDRLMVKEFDHTQELSVTILLDVFLHWSDGIHTEQIEYCFSLARTIAEFMEKKKVSYRLITNASNRSRNTVYANIVQAGQGARHLAMILYTLGQATSGSFSSVDQLYDMAVTNYSGESALIYVAPIKTDDRERLVYNLQKRIGSLIYPMYAASIMEEDQNA